jgi:hypothetical protein
MIQENQYYFLYVAGMVDCPTEIIIEVHFCTILVSGLHILIILFIAVYLGVYDLQNY